jgi:hypothetical protein
VIIKILFAILVLSSVALIGVAVAVSVRVWKHLKGHGTQSRISAEAVQESGQEVSSS